MPGVIAAPGDTVNRTAPAEMYETGRGRIIETFRLENGRFAAAGSYRGTRTVTSPSFPDWALDWTQCSGAEAP